MWKSAKEVGPKHSQMGIILGVELWSISIFWDENANNKCDQFIETPI
jgi:hypothetical protein